MFTIRFAQQQDLSAVCAVPLATWKATYLGILPSTRFNEVDDQMIAKIWAPIFAALDTLRHGVLVAEENGELIGIVHLSPSEEDPSGVMELARLHVLPKHQHRGVGSSLLVEAERFGKLRGFQHAALWVVDNHHAAQDFYKAQGWVPTGESAPRQGDGWSARELRYRVALPDL